MESILYVGMDVHKDTYSVCAYDTKNDKREPLKTSVLAKCFRCVLRGNFENAMF